MCGIVGVILKDQRNNLSSTYTTIFKQMLYADALRGWDSTGLFSIKQSGVCIVEKEAVAAGTFLGRINQKMYDINSVALVGHNRSATKGSINNESAHPFQEDHITLVHNGTLRTHRDLKNVDVDSHAICHSIKELGAVPTLEKLDGAYALIWHDDETGAISATRNSERPLYLSETKDAYILSSEYRLTEWITARNGETVKKVTLLEEGVLYSFKQNKKKQIFIYKKQYKPFVYVAPKIEPYKSNVSYLPNNSAPHPTFINYQKGDKVEVMPLASKAMGYNAYALGKTCWYCQNVEDHDMIIELFTDDPSLLGGEIIEAEIHMSYWNYGKNKQQLILCNPKLLNLDPVQDALLKKNLETSKQKIIGEIGTDISTRNGILLTKNVIQTCQDKYCEDCTQDFVASKDILLEPVISHGHIYTYRYYCPNCADWREIQRQTRRSN